MNVALSKLKVLAAIIGAGLLINLAPPAQAAAQSISYFMNGDCSDYYDEEEEYAFFESEPDWDCYISVTIKPVKPVRTIRLQYWNGKKWLQENSAKTGSSGKGYLYFDPYCSNGAYCDGEYKYRVVVDAASGQKVAFSKNFYVSYYPEEGSYDEEEES
jgi:hypothetical protein